MLELALWFVAKKKKLDMFLDYEFKSKLLKDLNERGFLYQTTDAAYLDNVFSSNKPVTFYVGFDPTAKSLHMGHLIWIVFINKMQKAGHRPIVLAGGATATIGDPTWKDAERSVLDDETVLQNMTHITNRLGKFIDFEQSSNKAILINNDDWISKLKLMDFLQNYGRFFSVNKMLTQDSISTRLENRKHLSFLEFSYSLLQAYDFLHLYEQQNCLLQVGGADQWSNIISGVDLIRRAKGAQALGMTFPLLVSASGKKMGKTESGAIWLSPDLTSPFEFWQYFRNVDDNDVIKLLKIFTDTPLDKIKEMEGWLGSSKINDAKILLADEVTSFVHSKDDVVQIHTQVKAIFIDKDLESSDFEEITVYAGERLDKIMTDNEFTKSLGEARRLIQGGGVKIDSEKILETTWIVEESCTLSIGKKIVVRLVVCQGQP